jgi:O-antigen ligase
MLKLKISSKNKILGVVAVILMNFMAYGFPIQSFLPFILNRDSNLFNVSFRILTLSISLSFIVWPFLSKGPLKISYGWLFFLCFWFAYSLRLIYDLEIQKLAYLDTDSFYVYSFAFGVCLVPTIGIFSIRNLMDYAFSLKVLFWMLFISNICLIYSILSIGQWNLIGVIATRATVATEINGVEKSIINPITIGFFGQLLTITAIHLISFPIFSNKNMRYIIYCSIFIGVLNLILGASRGPFIILFVLLLFEIYLISKQKKLRLSFYLKIASLILGLLFALTKISQSYGIAGDIELINRISETYENKLQDGEKEERDYLFESGIRQFTESPIFGDAFVTRYFYLYNSYSHNIIIDVLMSLGLVGLFLFGGFLYHIFVKIKRIVNHYPQNTLYVILFAAQFLTAMLSGSLFLSNGFWLMGAILIALPLKNSIKDNNANN